MAAAPREVGASAACSRCGWDRGCIVCYDKSAAWHWIRLLSVLGFGKICWVLILHCHITITLCAVLGLAIGPNIM